MEEVGRSWAWVLFFGFLTLVVGVLVLAWPEATLKVFGILFGLELLLVGLFRLVRSFSGGEQHRVWSVFLAVFSVIAGIIVLRNVAETVVVLTLILGVYWVIHGIIEFVMAIGDETFPQRAFTIFLGVLSVIAGIVVLAYPVKSATTMAWLLGIWFVVLGILGIIMSFMVRSAAKTPNRLTAA